MQKITELPIGNQAVITPIPSEQNWELSVQHPNYNSATVNICHDYGIITGQTVPQLVKGDWPHWI